MGGTVAKKPQKNTAQKYPILQPLRNIEKSQKKKYRKTDTEKHICPSPPCVEGGPLQGVQGGCGGGLHTVRCGREDGDEGGAASLQADDLQRPRPPGPQRGGLQRPVHHPPPGLCSEARWGGGTQPCHCQLTPKGEGGVTFHYQGTNRSLFNHQ